MDIIMPNLDGVSATACVREVAPKIPIIAMTSNIRPEDVDTYFHWGESCQAPLFPLSSTPLTLPRHDERLGQALHARRHAEDAARTVGTPAQGCATRLDVAQYRQPCDFGRLGHGHPR